MEMELLPEPSKWKFSLPGGIAAPAQAKARTRDMAARSTGTPGLGILRNRRPHGVFVDARIIGKAHLAGAVGVHHVDLRVAVAGGGEGDAGAVRRPIRVAVVRGGSLGQVLEPGAVRIDRVDLEKAVAVRDEGDPAPSGARDGRGEPGK